MRDGTLPAGMALVLAALMLGYLPRRTALIGVIITALVAAVASLFPLSRAQGETMIVASCVMVAVDSLAVYWPGRASRPVVLGLSALTGLVAGLTLATASSLPMGYLALLALSTVLPASLAAHNGLGVAPRVVASWLVAVALLAAVLPFATSHPGYVPDHRG